MVKSMQDKMDTAMFDYNNRQNLIRIKENQILNFVIIFNDGKITERHFTTSTKQWINDIEELKNGSV